MGPIQLPTLEHFAHAVASAFTCKMPSLLSTVEIAVGMIAEFAFIGYS